MRELMYDDLSDIITEQVEEVPFLESEISQLKDEIYDLENDLKNGRFSDRKFYEDELKTHLKNLKEELKFLEDEYKKGK